MPNHVHVIVVPADEDGLRTLTPASLPPASRERCG